MVYRRSPPVPNSGYAKFLAKAASFDPLEKNSKRTRRMSVLNGLDLLRDPNTERQFHPEASTWRDIESSGGRVCEGCCGGLEKFDMWERSLYHVRECIPKAKSEMKSQLEIERKKIDEDDWKDALEQVEQSRGLEVRNEEKHTTLEDDKEISRCREPKTTKGVRGVTKAGLFMFVMVFLFLSVIIWLLPEYLLNTEDLQILHHLPNLSRVIEETASLYGECFDFFFLMNHTTQIDLDLTHV